MSAEEVEEMEGPQDELVPRWRTKVFAMECVHLLLATVRAQPGAEAHFDMARAAALAPAARQQCLVAAVAELVKLVFFAATSPIDPLRPAGVRLMGDLVHYFGASGDPLAPGHRLLELYEVQFASALARAFQPDAPPAATARACDVLVDLLARGVCARSSVPALVAHLTGAVPALRTRAPAPYGEAAATLVQSAFLRALARLSARAPALPADTQGPVAAALDACRPRLLQHWLLLLRDHAVLSSGATPAQCSTYRGAFYAPGDEAAARTWIGGAWLDVALAASTVLADGSGGVAAPPQQQLFVLFGLLAQELVAFVRSNESSSSSEGGGTVSEEDAATAVRALAALCGRTTLEGGAITTVHLTELLALLDHCARTVLVDTSPVAKHSAFFTAVAALVQQLAGAAPPAPLWDRLLALLARIVRRLVRTSGDAEGTEACDASLAEHLVAALAALARAQPSAEDDNDEGQQKQKQQRTERLLRLVLALLVTTPTQPLALAAAQAVRAALEHAAPVTTAQVAATLVRDSDAFTGPRARALAVPFAAVLALALLRPTTSAPPPVLLAGAAAALHATDAAVRRPVLDVLLAVLPAAASTTPALQPAARALLGACGPALTALTAAGTQPDAPVAEDAADVVRIALLAPGVAAPGAGPNAVGAALSVLQPLLAPAGAPGTPRAALHDAAFAGTMRLAAERAADFRAHVAALAPDARAALEGALRAAAEAAARAAALQQQQQEQARLQQQAAAARARPLALDFSKYSK